jgi:hypothetical protein
VCDTHFCDFCCLDAHKSASGIAWCHGCAIKQTSSMCICQVRDFDPMTIFSLVCDGCDMDHYTTNCYKCDLTCSICSASKLMQEMWLCSDCKQIVCRSHYLELKVQDLGPRTQDHKCTIDQILMLIMSLITPFYNNYNILSLLSRQIRHSLILAHPERFAKCVSRKYQTICRDRK